MSLYNRRPVRYRASMNRIISVPASQVSKGYKRQFKKSCFYKLGRNRISEDEMFGQPVRITTEDLSLRQINCIWLAREFHRDMNLHPLMEFCARHNIRWLNTISTLREEFDKNNCWFGHIHRNASWWFSISDCDRRGER